MEAIFMLVPISLIIVFGSLMAFVWAVNHEQYEDMDKEAERILFDEDTQVNDNKHN